MKLADMDRKRLSKEFQAMRDATEQQEKALAAGRRALKKGQPVIYIHGRPYADPAHQKDGSK